MSCLPEKQFLFSILFYILAPFTILLMQLSQTGDVTEERDLWGSAAYTLALKVTDKHSLNTAKKLHLCEKAWSKLARHFAVFLSEKDSVEVR